MDTQELSLNRCFNQGWEAFKANMGLAIGGFVIFEAISIVLAYIPGINVLFQALAMFPIMGGFYMLFLGIVKNLNPQIGELFSGFRSVDQWARWLGLGWLLFLYMLVAMLICAVPAGIPVAIAYFALGESSRLFSAIAVVAGLAFYVSVIAIAMRWAFVFYLGAEGATATQAIRTSEEWTAGIRWRIFWISFVLGLLGPAGFIACGVGMLFTIPLVQCCMTALYLNVKQMRTQQAAVETPSP